MIGIVNSICVAIFENVPLIFEKTLTYAEMTLAQFNRIFVIQFLNIGCLLLLADFSTGTKTKGETESNFPMLNGKFRDFDTLWYYDVGIKITIAMISNSIIGPFTGKLA